MNTKLLKQRILDLAIHGRLVPDCDLTQWKTIPLGEICDYGKCQTVSVENINDNDWILELEDIEKDTAKIIQYKTKSERTIRGVRHKFKKGCVLYSKLRTYLNKVLVPQNDGYCTTEIIPINFDSTVNPEFMCHVLRSPYFLDYTMQKGYGVKMPRLSTNDAKKALIPLPPLAEQTRIVSAIEKWFSLIDEIETNKESLQAAIKQTKSKVLDLAIKGKLVSQDINDEPASELLKRINKEKENLINQGKIKRPKKSDAVNAIQEFPFKIPNSWEWVRLDTICDKIVDGDHNPPKGLDKPTNYLMISSRNINHNQIENLDNVRYLSREVFEIVNERTKLNKGDVLFTSVGSLGRSCVYQGGYNLCFQRSVSIIHTLIYNYWLKYFFDSDYYQRIIVEKATGTAQMGFYLQQLSESLIPLPPLSEQTRIVSKIEEVFALLDEIERDLA